MSYPYPRVMNEQLTMELAAHSGMSLARFGDGELRLCYMGKHIAQKADKRLADELRAILQNSTAVCCIPNSLAPNGKPVMWGPTRYASPEYTSLYNASRTYGSSFVTRPDSAPWIDTPHYWRMCRSLWADKDVTLVIGTRGGSLTHLLAAKNVRTIYGPERDAYASIDELEEEIGKPCHPVLICLGPTATCLAERLARNGVQGLDLGHLGRFMPQSFLQ
jgi:hypothetical protein